MLDGHEVHHSVDSVPASLSSGEAEGMQIGGEFAERITLMYLANDGARFAKPFNVAL